MKKRTVGIIGTGRFASVLKSLFAADEGWSVKQCSRSAKVDDVHIFSFTEVSSCDIIIPAVPISALEEVIGRLSDEIPPHTHPLVVSVCSVMAQPERWLREGLGSRADLLVAHPLFGPQSTQHGKTFNNLSLVWNPIQIRHVLNLDHLKKLLQSRKLQIIEMSSDDHDQVMAKTQWMSFLFGQLGLGLGLKSTALDTQGFKSLLHNQAIVASDSKELFFDICVHNPHAQKQLRELQLTLSREIQQVQALIDERAMTETLESLRQEINALDEQLLSLIAHRMSVVKKVGSFKKKHQIAPLQPGRWREVLERLHQQAAPTGLRVEFIDDIWNRVHEEALQIEKKLGGR